MSSTDIHVRAAAVLAALASFLPAQFAERSALADGGRVRPQPAREVPAPRERARDVDVLWPVPPPNCPEEPPVASLPSGLSPSGGSEPLGRARGGFEWIPPVTRLVRERRRVGAERRQVWCEAEVEVVANPAGDLVTVVRRPAGWRTVEVEAHFETREVLEVVEPGRWLRPGR